MGVYAHFLEHGGCTSQLLSLYTLLSQPRTVGLSHEQICFGVALYDVSIRILDLGHSQQPKEPIQATGTWDLVESKSLSSATMGNN